MARPQRLEKLRHGRLLCGSVFRFFVETWNWLTAYVDNMKGDAETDPQSGYITIDRADPDHPVIRFRADKVAAGGGGEEFLHPFEVRWAQSQSEGQGAWVIWLPSSGSLVNYNGAWLTFSGTSAASGLPTGWVRAQGVSASATAVYLLVVTPPGQTSKRAMFASSSSASGVTVHFSVLVATMSVDSTTGARRVKQIVDSSVIIGAEGGGDVNLDDVSTDYNGDTEVQIKDWDTGTPAATTTIAQDIHDGNATAQAAVVSRTTGGVLQYKKPGTLAELTGSSVNVSSYPVITGVTWDGTNHQLVISSVQVTIANGIITAWNANQPATIETTSISSIFGS